MTTLLQWLPSKSLVLLSIPVKQCQDYSYNILVQVFGHDNVYRIGGDEFSVILKNTTEEFCQTLVERFYKEIAEKTQDIKISVAMGFGNYDSAIDESYESFFKRIDEEMYHNKKKMKALGETSDVLIKEQYILSFFNIYAIIFQVLQRGNERVNTEKDR